MKSKYSGIKKKKSKFINSNKKKAEYFEYYLK